MDLEGDCMTFQPEKYTLGNWRHRVAEVLNTAIALHIEHKGKLPSVDEYRDMACRAIETAEQIALWRPRARGDY